MHKNVFWYVNIYIVYTYLVIRIHPPQHPTIHSVVEPWSSETFLRAAWGQNAVARWDSFD